MRNTELIRENGHTPNRILGKLGEQVNETITTHENQRCVEVLIVPVDVISIRLGCPPLVCHVGINTRVVVLNSS